MFPNIPKRTTALIQVWTSVALIILALIISFMPIIKINTSNLQESVENLIDDAVDNAVDEEFDKNEDHYENDYNSNDDYGYNDNEDDYITKYNYSSVNDLSDDELDDEYLTYGDYEDTLEDSKESVKDDVKDEIKEQANLDGLGLNELPTEVEITVPKLISGAIFLGDFMSEMSKEDADIVGWLDEALEDEKNQENLTTAIATLSLFTDSIDTKDSNALSMVFNIMIVLLSVLYIFALMFILPIFLFIIAIISLVHALKNKNTPEEATSKVASKLPGLLSLLFLLILFQCAIPQISYAWGAVVLLVITMISIIMNTVMVRLPAYRKEDMKYANIVQGISLVGIVGFLVFFFNFIKTGILSTFLKGPFFPFMQEFSDAVDKYNKLGVSKAEITSSYMTDGILMLFYIFFALVAVSYISGAASRFSLSSKKGGALIAFPILSLPLFIIPTVMKSSKNLNIIVEGETIIEESSLLLSDKSESALTLALVGIIIMLLAEIAYLVVPKILCKDMSKEDMKLVLTGNAPDPSAPAEASATEAEPAEEAKATEKTASK